MTDEEIIDIARQATHAIANASLYAAEKYAPKPRNVFHMLGDYFRDASVLILIFVPIEVTIPEYVNHQAINLAVVKWTIGISLATLIVGLGLEYFGETYSEWRS